MKTKNLLKIVPLLGLLGWASAQTVAERLEQGVQLQTAEGDLEAAISEYKAVLKEAARSHRLAAEARYRLAECYAAMGNEERMQVQLQALRDEFPPDNKWVVKGEGLAPVVTEFTGTPWRDGRVFHYEIKMPTGDKIGDFLIAQRRVSTEPEEIWESIAVRNAGGKSLSRTEFTTKGHLPLRSRWFIGMMGEVKIDFKEGGKAIFSNGDTGERTDEYDHAASKDARIPVFENEQMIQVIRTLNQEVGTKQKTIILSAHAGATPIPFDLEVVGHEEVTVGAGTFQCVKVESSIKQDFYISTGPNRELIRMDVGPVTIDLASSEEWKLDVPHHFESKPLGASFSIPGAMFYSPEMSKDEVYRLQVWASDFAGHDGLLEINKKSHLLPKAQGGSREYAAVLHEGFAKNYDEFEVKGDWETIEIDGVDAVAMKIESKKGSLVTREYQVHAVGEELALSFRLDYAKPDEERAMARAKEIVETFRW
ncbi:MAG: tetratricopeptide repeat protein [Verrucomicrobiaceae bacterium]